MSDSEDEIPQHLLTGVILQRPQEVYLGLQAPEEDEETPPKEEESLTPIDVLCDMIEEDERDDDPRNTIIHVEGLLAKSVTCADNWTHLVLWPQSSRHHIVVETDAQSLYRAIRRAHPSRPSGEPFRRPFRTCSDPSA